MEGIVTLEDLLEEIVGEIEDEFDLPDETVERVDDDTIRIDGTFPIDDFNEQFHCDLPQEDYHTVAGFVFGELGRSAEPGDEVAYHGVTFRVDSVEGQRIDRLTVTFQPWHQREQPGADDTEQTA
jgi:putative hemolysin